MMGSKPCRQVSLYQIQTEPVLNEVLLLR